MGFQLTFEVRKGRSRYKTGFRLKVRQQEMYGCRVWKADNDVALSAENVRVTLVGDTMERQLQLIDKTYRLIWYK